MRYRYRIRNKLHQTKIIIRGKRGNKHVFKKEKNASDREPDILTGSDTEITDDIDLLDENPDEGSDGGKTPKKKLPHGSSFPSS